MAGIPTSLWQTRHRKLARRVATAALDLFAHVGRAESFLIPLDENTPHLIVAAGTRDGIKSLLDTEPLPGPPIPMTGQRKAQAFVTTAAQATTDALLAMTRALQAGGRQEFEREVEDARKRLAAAQADLEHAVLQQSGLN